MRPLALITGASGGLGEQFARLWAAEGFDLTLVARRKDLLDALKAELERANNISVTVLTEDLSDPASAERVADAVKDKPVDVLVNNAGFGDYGPFKDADPVRMEQMLNLNCLSLTTLSRLLVPGMLERGHGRVLNVASTAAFLPGPLMAVYYATKAYVLSFSIALRNECKNTGVTVTCLCPGPTKTGFVSGAHLQTSRLFTRNVMSPLAVARQGYEGCMRGKPMVVPGFANKCVHVASRLSPRTWAAAVVRIVQSPVR